MKNDIDKIELTIMKKIVFFISGLLFAANSFSQWVSLNTGYDQLLTSISAVDDNTVWVCGHLGRVCRTTNGGTNWTVSIATPDTLTLQNIYGVDQNTAFVAAKDYSPNSASLWKTTNGGNSWQMVFNQPSGLINAVEVFSSGNGIMTGNPVGGRWSLWRTTNFGSNWDSAGMYVVGTGNSIENSLFTRGNEYWFGASGGRLYYTSNSGSNWSFQTMGSSNIIGVWLNAQTGIATGSGGYRTTNGGANWQTITIPGTGYQKPICGYGSNFWMVTRGSVNIYSTTNNGDNWNNYISAFQHSDIAVSRTGSVVWVATLSPYVLRNSENIGIQQISAELPSDYSLSQNYPNPFNPVTNIEFEISQTSDVNLTIYDVNGKELEVLVSSKLNAGTYKAAWDASKYSSGIYLYTIKSENFQETKKMILIK